MSERKIPDVTALVAALRCTASTERHCHRDCPYLIPEDDEIVKKICAEYGYSYADMTFGAFDECDFDRIVLDAAALLETLWPMEKTDGGADNGL